MQSYERLIDSRLGLIKRVLRSAIPPELPRAYVAYGADVADTQRFGAWQADRVALGATFYDHERARQAAIGEAVERYCGNWIPANLKRATYRELRNAGIAAIDPAACVLYSEQQYRQRGFPFVPFTHDLPVRWAPGRDLHSGEPVLLPASLVYINYFLGPYADEPPTNFIMYAGIAAGPDRAAAERSGLEELIERDATMIWWLSGSPTTLIDHRDTPLVAAALQPTSDNGMIDYHLFAVPNAFGLPVLGAMVEDRQHELLAIGFACRPDPTAAALKALAEAVHLRMFSHGLLTADGDVWQAMESGIFDGRAYKPFRADRSYRDAFRADFHDVTDLGAHAQIYLDPRMRVHVERILQAPARQMLQSVRQHASAQARQTLLDRLAEWGLRAYSVDVTTPDVAAAGLCVVRVLVPGLYPNFPAAFPTLGGRRLYEEPALLGWLPNTLDERQINLVPLPHT